ncbi:MAG TPA: prenyltransferase [Usitatibacteraceae bacterium]|nr:prenyltransferase [Usitatibacteraceae bacterium]
MAFYAGARPGIGDFLRIVDIRTKIVSVSSLLVGSGWALVTVPDRFSWGLFALMAAATLLIDMGTTGFNSYFDFVTGVDTRESDQERFKALVQSEIDPRIALHLSFALYAVAMPLGLAIGTRAGWSVVAAGAFCMVFAFFYSGGPHALSRTPVGEFFAGGLLGGALVAIAAFVHTQRLDGATLLVGLPSSLIIAGILSTNNACDRVGDARAGRRTLAIVLGPERSHWPVFALVAAAFAAVALLAALRVLPPWAFLPMVPAAAFAWRTLAAMKARGWSHATKAANMGGISLVFIAFTACLLASFALGA